MHEGSEVDPKGPPPGIVSVGKAGGESIPFLDGGSRPLLLRLARFGLYCLVGFAVFVVPAVRPGDVWILAGAYATAGLMMAWWQWLDHVSPRGSGADGPLLVALVGIAAVASAATSTPNGGALFCLSIMSALAAGSQLKPSLSWLVLAAGALAFEVGAASNSADTVSLLGLPLLLVVAGLAGYNRRGLRLRAEQSTALLAQAMLVHDAEQRIAVLDERSRLAREIHDVLAHSLGGLGVQVQAARAVLSDTGDVAVVLRLLDQAQKTVASGVQDTRQAVHLLRADPLPLLQEVTLLAARHSANYHVPVDVHPVGQLSALPAAATVALLRTAQEALLNAAKHAPGQPLDITLTYQTNVVTLDVSNATGIRAGGKEPATPATVGGGFGLIGLRERLLLQHGNLSVRSSGGQWTLTAQVPA